MLIDILLSSDAICNISNLYRVSIYGGYIYAPNKCVLGVHLIYTNAVKINQREKQLFPGVDNAAKTTTQHGTDTDWGVAGRVGRHLRVRIRTALRCHKFMVLQTFVSLHLLIKCSCQSTVKHDDCLYNDVVMDIFSRRSGWQQYQSPTTFAMHMVQLVKE